MRVHIIVFVYLMAGLGVAQTPVGQIVPTVTTARVEDGSLCCTLRLGTQRQSGFLRRSALSSLGIPDGPVEGSFAVWVSDREDLIVLGQNRNSSAY
jgi:hypothetical protein